MDGTAPESDEHQWLRVRPLVIVLIAQLIAGAALLVWVAKGRHVPGLGSAPPAASAAEPARPKADGFDEQYAWRLLRRQVLVYGERPAGSKASRALANDLKARLPNGRLEPFGNEGLQNVVGEIPGSAPHIVVGAHYDTEATIPGHVGANDGAAGTAAVVTLARGLAKAKRPAGAPAIRFVLFDGEEEPPGTEGQDFQKVGLRGSKHEAAKNPKPESMILLDYIAEKRGLSIPREGTSDPAIWKRLRSSAKRVGTTKVFPPGTGQYIIDDHIPFIERGVPSIDLIDFEYPQRDTTNDDLSRVSVRSLDAVGETVNDLLARWR